MKKFQKSGVIANLVAPVPPKNLLFCLQKKADEKWSQMMDGH